MRSTRAICQQKRSDCIQYIHTSSNKKKKITDIIPEQIVIIEETPEKEDFREQIKLARTVMRFSLYVPLVFLLIASLLVVRSGTGWLLWWGWPLFITGILGLILGWFGAPLILSTLNSFLSERLNAFPAILLDPATSIAKTIIAQMLQSTTYQALILDHIGVIMVILGTYLRRNPSI